MVVQKQQIAGAEGVQNREADAFAAAPELLDQRTGIKLAVKGEKQRHGMGQHHRRECHHAVSGLLGVVTLLVAA